MLGHFGDHHYGATDYDGRVTWVDGRAMDFVGGVKSFYENQTAWICLKVCIYIVVGP